MVSFIVLLLHGFLRQYFLILVNEFTLKLEQHKSLQSLSFSVVKSSSRMSSPIYCSILAHKLDTKYKPHFRVISHDSLPHGSPKQSYYFYHLARAGRKLIFTYFTMLNFCCLHFSSLVCRVKRPVKTALYHQTNNFLRHKATRTSMVLQEDREFRYIPQGDLTLG